MRIEFYSSVSVGRLWAELAKELRFRGYETHIVAAIDSNEYRSEKSRLAKLRTRWRLTGGFAIYCATRLLRNRVTPDSGKVIRIVSTNPFFLPMWVQLLSKRSDRTVFLVYDLYPEALIAAGWIRRDSLISRLIGRITCRTLRACDATVFLGRRIQHYVSTVYTQAANSVVIPVGALRGTEWKPPILSDLCAPILILYVGVMGRMHDVKTLAGVLACGIPSGVKFKIHATGKGREWLRAQPGARRIEWGNPLSDAEWELAMRNAPVALVTLSADAEKVALPSKTYSALAAGQAILAICSPESDLADMVRSHNCGWVVAPGDVAGLLHVISEISDDTEALHIKRSNAYKAGNEIYGVPAVAAQWTGLFARIEKMRYY